MNIVSLGIDLGGSKILLTTDNKISTTLKTGSGFTPSELLNIIEQFLTKNQLSVNTIGLAVPGIVENDNQIVISDVLPAFSGWNVAQVLAKWSCKIAVLNDVKAALYEVASTAKKDANILTVMAGTAIGSAFMINGQIVEGSKGWAGELGYFPILTNDKILRLDELAGGAFMAQQLGLSAEEFQNAVAQNHAQALHAIYTGGQALGTTLAGLINFLNPDLVAIGGGVLNLPGYWSAIQEHIQRFSLTAAWNTCTLQKIEDKKVVALGAIKYANRTTHKKQP